MSKRTFDAIQAVLLDSEEDPWEEIRSALDAVAEFALLECEANYAGFQIAATKAWDRAEEKERQP